MVSVIIFIVLPTSQPVALILAAIADVLATRKSAYFLSFVVINNSTANATRCNGFFSLVLFQTSFEICRHCCDKVSLYPFITLDAAANAADTSNALPGLSS